MKVLYKNMNNQDIYGNLEVGSGVVIKGECIVPNRASIAGDVSGKLVAHEVDVERLGIVAGEVQAQNMDVRGQIKDQVKCDGFMMVRQTGVVDGQVSYNEVEVEKGGILTGQLQRQKL